MKTRIHRREFVRQDATATPAATTLLGSGLGKVFAGEDEYTPKSEAQFKNEAAQYASAIRELRRISQLKPNSENLTEATATIEKAAPALKYQLSSFVVMCLSSPVLVNAVKKRIPSRAAVDSFIDAGAKDLQVFLQLDGVKDLQARIRETAAEHREVVRSAADSLQKASGAPDSLKEMKRAEEDEKCPLVFPIIVAIVAVVVAIFTFGASVTASPPIIARPLIMAYGPNFSDVVIERGQGIADTRYARCVAASNQLPPKEIAPAVARCQARWLNEKSYWLIAD